MFYFQFIYLQDVHNINHPEENGKIGRIKGINADWGRMIATSQQAHIGICCFVCSMAIRENKKKRSK
jgi:hypothetical protein